MRRVSVLLVIAAVECVALMPCRASAAEFENDSSTQQITSHLGMWDVAMGMTLLDHGRYPETEDIRELAMFVEGQGYWEAPVVSDPWGRTYLCSSSKDQFHIWTTGPDGVQGTSDDQSTEAKADLPPVAVSQPRARTGKHSRGASPKVGDNLVVTRDGDDVVLSWPATGITYDVVASSTPRFLQPELLAQQTATSFTYAGALSGGGTIEFFDVTDETETNRGEDGAGNLPPAPPTVDPFPGGALVIGGLASITGSGFSEVPGDNLICFAGGICLHPDTATTTQLDFTVPPSAVSGEVSVRNGILQSGVISTNVHLESPGVDTLYSIGFAPRPGGGTDVGGEFWTTSRVSGTYYVYRHYYDPGSNAWLRDDRSGIYTNDLHYLSTKTDRFDNLYAGMGPSPLPAGPG